MPRSLTRLLSAGVFLLAPSIALAHPGHGGDSGLTAGFVHPLSGIDHLLAMMAVGLLAARLGGRALWAVPASFLVVMVFGGLFGAAGASTPFVETAIALSLLVFGGAILSRLTLPAIAAMGLVGFFGFFHGYAHGVEMPATSSGFAFGAGFLAATAALHGVGLALGLSLDRLGTVSARRATQACGVVIGLVGAGLMIGTI